MYKFSSKCLFKPSLASLEDLYVSQYHPQSHFAQYFVFKTFEGWDGVLELPPEDPDELPPVFPLLDGLLEELPELPCEPLLLLFELLLELFLLEVVVLFLGLLTTTVFFWPVVGSVCTSVVVSVFSSKFSSLSIVIEL